MNHPVPTFLALALAGSFLPAQEPDLPPPPPQQARDVPPPPRQGRPQERPPFPVLTGLGLSPEQSKKVQALLEANRSREHSLQRAVHAAEGALHTAAEDPEVPEATLRDLNTKACDARFQALLAHRALAADLEALLTPEQRAKAHRILASRGWIQELSAPPFHGPDGPPEGPSQSTPRRR
jgi:Spy/CpxP family protein refolding chaperone